MEAGYNIDNRDFFSDTKKFIAVSNYHSLNEVENRSWPDESYERFPLALTAIFRLRPKVECDKCGKLTKDKEDAAGNVYCQSCEDNLNEERAERWANDAESFTSNDYSQYKSLK